MAQDQVVSHARLSQVQVAILEAKELVYFCIVVDVEGGSVRGVQHLCLGGYDLYLPRWEAGILRAWRPGGYLSYHLEHPFVSQLFCDLMGLMGHLWVEGYLDHPLSVSEVDKDEASVVSPTMYPPGKGHHLAYVFPIYLTTASVLEHNTPSQRLEQDL